MWKVIYPEEWAKLQGVEKGIPVSEAARKILDGEGKLSGLQYEASVVMDNNSILSPMSTLHESSVLYEAYIASCNLVLFEKSNIKDASENLYKEFKENI
jgi:oligogalacturonide transport system substrate-binding protein